MLRVTESTSARARSYFSEELSRGDAYYTHESQQEILGRWGGDGARMLGREGTVDKSARKK